MGNIEPLVKLDYLTVFLGVFVILFAIKEAIELVGYFKKKFRIKTGIEEDKETLENRIGKLEKHDKWQYDQISKISKAIDELTSKFDEKKQQDDAQTVATLRVTLYKLHAQFVKQGYVDKSGLKTFTELSKIYTQAGGNDILHSKLEPEVMSLPIRED